MLKQSRHILPKKRKGRIRNNDVRLIHKSKTFFGAKISISLKFCQFVFSGLEKLRYIEHIHAAVSGFVINGCNHGFIGLVLGFLAHAQYIKQRKLCVCYRRSCITGADKLLQSKTIEIQDEIFEKIALKRVIAITEYRFPLEMRSIITHLFLYIG